MFSICRKHWRGEKGSGKYPEDVTWQPGAQEQEVGHCTMKAPGASGWRTTGPPTFDLFLDQYPYVKGYLSSVLSVIASVVL